VKKYWVYLFFLFFILCKQNVLAKKKSMSDSLSHLAYSKTKHDSALIIFKKAEKYITNDTQKGTYYFYKYFYFLKNNYIDSVNKIQDYTFKYLSKTNQMEKFEWIFSTTYWVYVGESQYDKAMALTQKVEKITREVKDTFNHILTLNKLSNIYHDLSNYKMGIQVAFQSLKISKQLKNNLLISKSNAMLAMNYDDWGQYDSAIFYYYIILKLPLGKDYDYSQIYNNLGNTYLKLNQLDSALKYVKRAYEIDKLNKSKSYELATCVNNLGHIYLKKKDYKRAKFYLDTAYKYASESENHEKLRDVNYTFHLYYLEVGDYKNAYIHFKDYHQYKDSILDVKRLGIIQNLESKAKEATYQNELLKLENDKKIRNFWIALFSSLLFIALLIIRQIYLKRQKIAREAELKLQNERLRISRDLHDNIGAELTYISSIIDQKTFNLQDKTEKADLEKISESSRHAMSQMRETIWAIQSNHLDSENFVQKLQQVLEKYTKPKNIHLKFRSSGELYLLNPASVITVMRVCQEAVNNAIKYAQCNEIAIETNAEEHKLEVSIKDNGLGFDLEQIQRGNGLNNIKERINELKGDFSVESQIEKGTEIRFWIPI
jgi:two-component sensor histidine kinase/Tfp pilus assembly protein PilF